jgi:hypothetical protein
MFRTLFGPGLGLGLVGPGLSLDLVALGLGLVSPGLGLGLGLVGVVSFNITATHTCIFNIFVENFNFKVDMLSQSAKQ